MVATEAKKTKQTIPMEVSLTPTHRKIWEVIQDGRPHTVTELGKCLWDDLCDIVPNVMVHVSNLRNVINPEGYDVVHKRIQGEKCYILVKFLAPQPQLD